jgi:hypothetical protein
VAPGGAPVVDEEAVADGDRWGAGEEDLEAVPLPDVAQGDERRRWRTGPGVAVAAAQEVEGLGLAQGVLVEVGEEAEVLVAVREPGVVVERLLLVERPQERDGRRPGAEVVADALQAGPASAEEGDVAAPEGVDHQGLGVADGAEVGRARAGVVVEDGPGGMAPALPVSGAGGVDAGAGTVPVVARPAQRFVPP